MWSPTTQSGADVMKRIAAPMIGGVITSGILELLLYPVIYVIWRKRHLGTPLAALSIAALPVETTAPVVSNAQTAAKVSPTSRRRRPWLIIVLLFVVAIGVGGFFAWQKFGRGASGETNSGTPFAMQKVKDLSVNFFHPKGPLQNAMNDVLIEFRDSTSGELVDVGAVKFDLDMNMPGMVMHSGATIEATGTPGQYRAQIKPEMGGDWMATLHYEGPHGSGSTSFSVNVKQ